MKRRPTRNTQPVNPQRIGGTFVDYLLSKGHSTASVEAERRQLGYFFTWCDQEGMEPEEAGYRDLLAYVAHLRKNGGAERSRGVKPITMQKYMGTFRHFFAWQVKTGRRDDNPARDIDIQDIQRKVLQMILTRQELERNYKSYGTKELKEEQQAQNWAKASALATKRNKAILGLLVFQGLTSHEVAALTVKSLELRAGKVHVEGGRRHNGRTLTLEAAQVMDLMEYTLQTRPALLKLGGKGTDALFTSTGKGSSLNNTLHKLLEQITKLEPKVKTLQQLRASVITHWIKTLNLREAQHRAGHRYVSSTEAYLINDLEGLAEDVARFHPIG
ncbi:MAG: tyrosine-type recombinase/integrase [Flavobacteriales bacterium]|nr:tyrosine-type recombinase/integrase [Flavobacteriales bacterium]MEB2341554.1 tyrosine-type recombinase/integrase [Flavobacteriia bacterium]